MKIVYIGGGSAYAPGVLQAFISAPDVYAGTEITLVDVDQPNLDIVQRLGEKMARAAHVDLTITTSIDRAAALSNADFVLTSFRAGGFKARALDERIPLKYSVVGQETVGPGGFFFALRSLNVTRTLCAEIERICPNAWLINYANPTNIIGEAVSRFSRVKVLALCDGGKHDAFHVAEQLGRNARETEFMGYGLNHATWSTRFTIGGEDGVELMAREHDRVIGDPYVPSKVKRMFRLAKRYGRLPNEYMQYYYFPEETLHEANAAKMTRAEVVMSELPRIFAHYREQAECGEPHITLQRGGSGFGEFAVDVITAVVRSSGRVEMLNVPNKGVLPNLAYARVAEVPCRIDRSGATPLAQGEMPGELRGLISSLAEYQALAARAGWFGESREAAIEALAANPLMWKLDVERVEALYVEMAEAHRQWLPAGLL